ncbi:MAG: hypothetical protein HOE48_06345 [Candidatus Latescibacteria bacterium]|jgi:hypothetical protein|nr:hypothetical protein [Candidatus Latescibacterota bacterium]MBT4137516.1 hypothetical protein [Candidatus Latescibacterota bacterium]MBT5830982.1 hypothetical protein [Candidatus Latescibacterota bacterium]
MENLIDSLIKSLENASGRSIGMVMAVIGIVVWWVVSQIKKSMRVLSGERAPQESETVEIERPRRRLSLKVYHR